MARHLGVHKGTCQRIVEGAQSSRDGLHAFARFPGVAALRTFTAACEAHGVSGAVLAEAKSATDRFEAILRRLDVSQRGLLDLIASSTGEESTAVGDDRSRVERRSLFSAARRVTGESVEAKIAVGVLTPSPDKPGRVRVIVLASYRGARREPYARPIVAFMLETPDQSASSNGSAHLIEARFLPAFSSPGVGPGQPVLGRSASRIVLETDTVPEPDRGVDMTAMFVTDASLDRRVHPERHLTSACRIMQPTKLMINDVHCHKDLLVPAEPKVGCFSFMAADGDSPPGGYEESVHERFPERPHLEELRPGMSKDSPGRLAEDLARFAMSEYRLDPAAMRAWRCRVDYPLWQTEYRTYVT